MNSCCTCRLVENTRKFIIMNLKILRKPENWKIIPAAELSGENSQSVSHSDSKLRGGQ